MQVRHDFRIACRPELCGNKGGYGGNAGEGHEAGGQARLGAEPAGKRVGQQPAGVRQRELGRKQRWPILRVRGAAQQPAIGVPTVE